MKAAWATDVHLEFLKGDGFARFVAEVRALDAEALFLTGDIAQAESIEAMLRRVRAAVAIPVLFVLGNHDYYRGGVAEVRAMASALHVGDDGLRWLPAAGPWRAADGTVVVGVDGWGDGRAGAPETSTVQLNDWLLIGELSAAGALYDVAARRRCLAALADADAARLEETLRGVTAGAERVVVLTHVPPFEGACWHDGEVSNGEWLPWFTCVAVGAVLLRAARANPGVRFEVYCGHTHSPGVYRAAENMVVHTGQGRYGATFVRAVDIA
ncbi:MAG: phosphoesterase [Myxococcaceae bacterium]|nr:phosphoesterase [Myxococcaceae bacterium]